MTGRGPAGRSEFEVLRLPSDEFQPLPESIRVSPPSGTISGTSSRPNKEALTDAAIRS